MKTMILKLMINRHQVYYLEYIDIGNRYGIPFHKLNYFPGSASKFTLIFIRLINTQITFPSKTTNKQRSIKIPNDHMAFCKTQNSQFIVFF